jgi:hypothetical protein
MYKPSELGHDCLALQGVRFGSTELYNVIEDMKDEIEDCIA